MSPARKLSIGALATFLLASGWHAAMARSFVDGLAAAAKAEVAGAPGVQVVIADGSLHRNVLLVGPVSGQRERERLLADVRAIPGVASAKWSYDAGIDGKVR